MVARFEINHKQDKNFPLRFLTKIKRLEGRFYHMMKYNYFILATQDIITGA
jgi:hypothetical protein